MSDWETDIGDSLTAESDEDPDDTDNITTTLPVPEDPTYDGEAFFRIEEED